MNKLELSYFRSLEITEVYVYYDRPLLFACKDILEQTYLAVFAEAEEDEDGEETGNEIWLYVALSPRRFEMVRSGGIDLRTAFGQPETGYVYRLYISPNEDVQIVEKESIKKEWLPKPGAKLERNTNTIPQKNYQQAAQSLRERISMKFNFRGFTRSEAPVGVLGNIMVNFQNLYSDLNERTAPMRVVGFSAGSFGIELESEGQFDLSEKSNAANVMRELTRLLDAREPKELEKRVESLNSKAQKSLKGFMKSITGQVEKTQINWTTPSDEHNETAIVIPSEKAFAVLEVFKDDSQEEEKEDEIIHVTGILRGINLDTKYFSIVTTDKIQYSGHISNEAVKEQVVQSAQINRVYTATLEKKRTHIAKQNQKTRLVLQQLSTHQEDKL